MMSPPKGWELKDNLTPDSNANICCVVKLDKEAQDDFVQTSVYDLNYLYGMIQRLRMLNATDPKVQIRFVNNNEIGIIMLVKMWGELPASHGGNFFPESPDEYIALCPVFRGENERGFHIWSELKQTIVREVVVETITEYIPSVSEVCQNHAGMIDEDAMDAVLEGAIQ
jgi:hypothetical protein